MAPQLTQAFDRLIQPFAAVAGPLVLCAVVFVGLAWLTKGRAALADARAGAASTRINAAMFVVDTLAVGPVLALGVAVLGAALAARGLQLHTAAIWSWMGRWPTVLAALVIGDAFGYWRHRAQHSRWFWPAHAVHHSDTHLNWFSLERVHPIDRIGSLSDTVFLALLGFPPWALAANALARHYYGYFIHADLPWTFGRASLVLSSPVMHRWHHARDVEGSGCNFATFCSVWDRAFGTYHQPGPCTVPTGVREDVGRSALGQYAHPFKTWWEAIRPARGRVRLSS